MPPAEQRNFTAQEIAIIRAMDRAHASAIEIADRIGRSRTSVQYVVWKLRREGRIDAGEHTIRSGPPNAVLLDRDKRERAADSMSLTAQLFGDPPPGFSALDRRGPSR